MTIELIQLPTGLYELHLPDGTVVASRDGGGLTLAESEQVLDYLELRQERKTDGNCKTSLSGSAA